MATVTKWNPFGVSLNITANAVTVTRTSATKYTVKINVSWDTYWDSAKTDYGMKASSGGKTVTLNSSGNKSSGSSGSLTGEYTISGNGSATKTITVTFENFNTDHNDSATKSVSFNVTVSAWTSYAVKYNANGGTGAPSTQTKWKDQTLVLSTTKPTRTGYSFLGWSTSSTATSATYSAGGNYTANAAATLYAVWKANTYAVKYDANGGSGAPSGQTKTYGVTLTLSTTVPTRQYYNFLGWSTSKTATTPTYSAGANYTANAAITLYAVWELAYVKPRITNVVRNRCDASGNLLSDGENARIEFYWSCDRTVTSITVGWRKSNDGTYTTKTISASGTEGSVSTIINNLSADQSYDIRIVVTDIESSTMYTDIPGLIYVVNGLIGGTGVAFGKKAETPDIADFAWPLNVPKGFLYPTLPANTDLNNVTAFNTYRCDSASSAAYVNCPISSSTTFTLEVLPAGDLGQIMQRLTTCSATPAIYIRHYYSGEWHDWVKTY